MGSSLQDEPRRRLRSVPDLPNPVGRYGFEGSGPGPEIDLAPPSGNPVEISVTIEVSGPGAAEAIIRGHSTPEVEVARELAGVLHRAFSFVPVEEVNVDIRRRVL